MADKYEQFEETVNPERRDERARAAAEARDRLRSHGVVVSDHDSADEVSQLIDAVEGFEAAVERHGGDLMVDDLESSRPDDRHFVLPRRIDGESAAAYAGRIADATVRLARHPRHTD